MKIGFSPLIDQLIDGLRCLPGVGPKTAQRMAFYLLERARPSGQLLATILQQAMAEVQHCQRCRTLCENDLCGLCQSPNRDRASLCIVETPADVVAVEQAGGFRGSYFVLMGHLSPLDGIGPAEIGIEQLMARIAAESIKEVILATNPTVEGEATAHYIASLLKNQGIRITRIAHGVPLGGDLETVDGSTLHRALMGRTAFDHSQDNPSSN